MFELGKFKLDPASAALTHDGNPTGLGPRGVAVLVALVERAEEYVSKATLLQAAWPNVVVEEGNLPVQIAAIRRILAADGGEDWIETLPRRGYRFVGPVRKLTNDPPVSPATRRSNLPAPHTSFIGRERELVEIKRLLPSKRLITILGAGGIGKTRLALQVAAEVVDAYRDGVWIAELGSIRDPTLVSATVCQLLGVADKAGKPSAESLCAYLKSRELLLVLDNCEHLVDACARLANALLRETKETAIIATSREPLRLPGEQSYSLQPLSLPEVQSPEAIRSSEAVQLFVERVQQHLAGFELTADREPAVAEICIHLDGIPLALELAAARTRSLSVEQISARLADRFRLLTGGSRTALPRQQTLRATLDWSYDLLTEDERVVLRRLSVFPGSFAVEAASAVASDQRIDDYAVIDLVAQLVSRSLVIADTSTRGAYYRLLETMRAYALEKLVETGEFENCKRRHAEYVRDFFAPAPDDWLRKPGAAWRAKYEPHLADIRAAFESTLGGACAPIGISLAGASGVLFASLGLFEEGIQCCERAMACIDSSTPLTDQARLWHWFGRLVDKTPARSRTAFERSADLYRQLGDRLGLGLSLARLARALTYMGKFKEAEAALAEARPHLEASGLPMVLDFYFYSLAFLKSHAGEYRAARDNYERSLAINRTLGDEFAVLGAMANIANTDWALGDLDAALASFRDLIALARASSLSTNRLLGYALMKLGSVLTERGELTEALFALREGAPLVREDGSMWVFLDDLALRLACAGKLADAARLAGYADSVHAAKAATRSGLTLRLRGRLMALLHEELSADDLARLLAEGAKLSEDEACRLALED
jgi:predicted ATPase/DNA-binding winged helix-turn-helix (wHTH) protein